MNRYFVIAFLFMWAGILGLPAYGHNLYGNPEITINITDQGFFPDEVNISQGTAIVWVNLGLRLHWPASDLHPTHNRYPGSGIEKCNTEDERHILDSCNGLKTNESFKFYFDEAGRWILHDHLNPTLKMNVKVANLGTRPESKSNSKLDIFFQNLKSFFTLNAKLEAKGLPKEPDQNSEPKTSAKNIAAKSKKICYDVTYKNISDKLPCYARQFENIAFENGQEFAFEALGELQKIDETAKICHVISHGIGWGIYEHNPSKWKELIASINPTCVYGALHGVLERYVQDIPGKKITKEMIPGFCESNPTPGCIHAVGHLLLVEAGNNIDDAIGFCRGYSGNTDRHYCLTGIFMEHMIGDNLFQHGFYDRERRQRWYTNFSGFESICRSQKGENAIACWEELIHASVIHFRGNPVKVFEHCNSAQIFEGARLCRRHAIGDLVSWGNQNLSKIKFMCSIKQENDSSFENECYSLIAISVSFSLPSENLGKVIKFCSSLDRKFQGTCFSSVGDTLKRRKIPMEISGELCDEANEFKEYCLGIRNTGFSRDTKELEFSQGKTARETRLNSQGTGKNNFKVVIINDSGFFPSSIRISQGTKVVWIIKGSKLHWPASDIHPTHTRYPGSGIEKCGTAGEKNIFDACEPLANGQEYSFVFGHSGNWSAHDHVNPSFNMNIEVTGNSGEIDPGQNGISQSNSSHSLLKFFFPIPKEAANMFKSTKKSETGKDKTILQDDSAEEAALIRKSCETGNKENCYEESFRDEVRKNGMAFAKETLYKIWDLDPSTRSCHLLAHAIAQEATRLNPEKWKEYIDTADYTVCSAGFLHGIFEVHIGDDPSFKIDSANINAICLADGDYYKKQNCIHYMGHLLMLEHSGKINASLDGCGGVSEGLNKRCYTGVFMEDSYPIGLVGHAIRDKLPNRKDAGFVNKQISRCLEFTGDIALACWIDMGENFGIFYNDPQKVYEACYQAPEDIEKRECFLKAAGLFAIHPEYSSPDKLAGTCNFLQDKEIYKSCIGRMTSSLLYYSPKFIDRGVSVCLKTAPWYTMVCFSELSRKLKEIAPDAKTRKEFCKLLPPEHKDFCSQNSKNQNFSGKDYRTNAINRSGFVT